MKLTLKAIKLEETPYLSDVQCLVLSRRFLSASNPIVSWLGYDSISIENLNARFKP